VQILLQTNDPVLLSYVQSVLDDAGIHAVVLDQSMSAIEGSIGVFPRRVMVMDDDAARARTALWQAGLSAELAPLPHSS
jgi:hypothetical protein